MDLSSSSFHSQLLLVKSTSTWNKRFKRFAGGKDHFDFKRSTFWLFQKAFPLHGSQKQPSTDWIRWGDPMAQLVWRWSCQRWQTAGGGSNPCWSTRESQVRPAERQRAPTKKKNTHWIRCLLRGPVSSPSKHLLQVHCSNAETHQTNTKLPITDSQQGRSQLHQKSCQFWSTKNEPKTSPLDLLVCSWQSFPFRSVDERGSVFPKPAIDALRGSARPGRGHGRRTYRPTPLGFRQVVQHVRLHFAAMSELVNWRKDGRLLIRGRKSKVWWTDTQSNAVTIHKTKNPNNKTKNKKTNQNTQHKTNRARESGRQTCRKSAVHRSAVRSNASSKIPTELRGQTRTSTTHTKQAQRV